MPLFLVCPICKDEIYAGDEYYDSAENDEEEPKHYWCVITSLKAEIEGLEARAAWLDQLVRKSHELLVHNKADEDAALLWTAYSTPPQFDKDGVSGMVQDDQ